MKLANRDTLLFQMPVLDKSQMITRLGDVRYQQIVGKRLKNRGVLP